MRRSPVFVWSAEGERMKFQFWLFFLPPACLVFHFSSQRSWLGNEEVGGRMTVFLVFACASFVFPHERCCFKFWKKGKGEKKGTFSHNQARDWIVDFRNPTTGLYVYGNKIVGRRNKKIPRVMAAREPQHLPHSGRWRSRIRTSIKIKRAPRVEAKNFPKRHRQAFEENWDASKLTSLSCNEDQRQMLRGAVGKNLRVERILFFFR